LPYTSVTVRGVALLCFPPDDVVFATIVRRAFEASTMDAPAALERQLRTAYPRAVVRSREALASFGAPAWYVYRDGRYSPFGRGARWWEDPAAARITVTDDGGYLDANPAALELLGVDRETLLASPSGSFTIPGFGAAIPWIMQLLRDTGELHSTAVLRPRGDRPVEPIEFHLVKDADGPGRHVSTIRRVPLEAVEPSVAADEPA
jgi:PAS domain-containing protein